MKFSEVRANKVCHIIYLMAIIFFKYFEVACIF